MKGMEMMGLLLFAPVLALLAGHAPAKEAGAQAIGGFFRAFDQRAIGRNGQLQN